MTKMSKISTSIGEACQDGEVKLLKREWEGKYKIL